MVQLHWRFTLVILIEDSAVAVESPPLTQLSIPAAGQRVEQLWVVERCHGVEVLVTEVTSEAILACQVRDHHFV